MLEFIISKLNSNLIIAIQSICYLIFMIIYTLILVNRFEQKIEDKELEIFKLTSMLDWYKRRAKENNTPILDESNIYCKKESKNSFSCHIQQ